MNTEAGAAVWAIHCWGAVTARPCSVLLALLLCTGCTQQMANQARYEPLEASEFFADGRAARDLPAGVVPRGYAASEPAPAEITAALLRRGQERYNIYCAPCHDFVGSGKGMAVLRGFRRPPPSFHIDRLRETPDEYFYDVITNGFGAMYDYAMQVGSKDRWAIIAYVRALQLSQSATVRDLTPEDLKRLDGSGR